MHRAVIGELGLVEACVADVVDPLVIGFLNPEIRADAFADRVVVRIIRADNRCLDPVMPRVDGQIGRSCRFFRIIEPIFDFKLQVDALRLQVRLILLAFPVVIEIIRRSRNRLQRDDNAHRGDDKPGAVFRIVAAAGRFLPPEGDIVVSAEVAIAVQMHAVDIIGACLGCRRTGDRRAFGIALRIDRKRPDLRGVVPRVEIVVPFARAHLGVEQLVHLVRRDAVGRALIVDVHGDRARRDFERSLFRLRGEHVVAQARGGFGIHHRHLHVVLADVAALAARRIADRLITESYAREHGRKLVAFDQTAISKVVQRFFVGIPNDVADFRAVDRRRAVRGEGERRLVNLKGNCSVFRDMVGRADAVIDFIRTVMVEVVPFENDIFERSDGFTEPRVQAEHPRYLVARGDGGRCSFRLRFDNIVGARVGFFDVFDRNFEICAGDRVYFARLRFRIQDIVIHAVARFQANHHIVSADIDGLGRRAALVISKGVKFFLRDVFILIDAVVRSDRRNNPAARVGKTVARRIGDRYTELALVDRELARHGVHRIVGEIEFFDRDDVRAIHGVARGVYLAAVYARPIFERDAVEHAVDRILHEVVIDDAPVVEAVLLFFDRVAVGNGNILRREGERRLIDDVIGSAVH